MPPEAPTAPVVNPPEVVVDGGVTVDLNKKPGEAEHPAPAPAPSTPPEDLTHLRNQLAGNRRITEKIQQELDELKRQRVAPVAPTTPPSADPTDPERLMDAGKWQEAVAVIAEKKAQALYEQRRKDEEAQQEALSRAQRLEKSMQLVASKYPDLDTRTGNPDSPTNQLYIEVLNSDPTLIKNEYGPEVAMRRMEDLARERGIALTTVSPSANGNKEVVRRARSAQASLGGQAGGSDGKVTLTREQKEFCDVNQIDYKSYARNLSASTRQEGITP